MKGQQCEAFVHAREGDHRCQLAAKHFHETPGDAVHLCQRHYKMIVHRQRQGSDEEKVREWRSRL